MKHLETIQSTEHSPQIAVIASEFRESDSYAVIFFSAGKLVLKSSGYLSREEAEKYAHQELAQLWPTQAMQTITLDLKVDNVFAASVLDTALTGGIDYWADHEILQYSEESEPTVTYLTDCTGEDCEDLPKYVDLDVIRLGIKRALVIDACRQDIRETILTAVASDDVGQIDAEAADVIVQLGLFDDVVFG